MMIRKWLVFSLTAGILVAIGVLAGPGRSRADDKETPLGKIMERVNKNNSTIQKGVRTKVAFAKAQKDVEKSAKAIAKLAKEAKPITDAVKKAKDVANPQKTWDDFMDELIKKCEHLGKVAAKPDATFQDAKAAFGEVKKVCTDCHKDFRVDEDKF
ncbi:MAG: cytochrome c [Isosphaerales bacterium]